MNEIFSRRFQELEAKRQAIAWHSDFHGITLHVKNGDWQGWATSALSLIRAVYGETSEQYEHFSVAYKKCTGTEHTVRTLFNLFGSAKDDFEGGYVFNVELRVSGAVLGDFVALAKTALAEGYKDVAAVLACAALEDALKRYASVQGLVVQDKAMSDVINALKSAGRVSGAQKAMLEKMPAIRNFALHANWEKIETPEIGGVIGFVELFLISNFSD